MHTFNFFTSPMSSSASSSFLLKKVDVSYARVAAALVVLLPSSAFCLRLYKDSVAE